MQQVVYIAIYRYIYTILDVNLTLPKNSEEILKKKKDRNKRRSQGTRSKALHYVDALTFANQALTILDLCLCGHIVDICVVWRNHDEGCSFFF